MHDLVVLTRGRLFEVCGGGGKRDAAGVAVERTAVHTCCAGPTQIAHCTLHRHRARTWCEWRSRRRPARLRKPWGSSHRSAARAVDDDPLIRDVGDASLAPLQRGVAEIELQVNALDRVAQVTVAEGHVGDGVAGQAVCGASGAGDA